MTGKQLFISHKHQSPDKDIARVLANFVKNRSNNTIDVHLSSDPKFGGPEVGGGLTEQLRQALSTSGVVLLVYTKADQDWSYCMWECGVATDPDNAATNVKVIQCGNEVPKPFANDVRIDARDHDSVEGFVRTFMTSPSFFPNGESVTRFEKSDPEVAKAAKKLYDELAEVLPSLDEKKPIARTAWPFLSIEMDNHQVESLRAASGDSREDVACGVLRESVVVASDQAEGVFGINFEARQSVAELLQVWQDKHPGEDPEWFAALALQLLDGAKRLSEPTIRWRPLTRSSDGAKLLLVLGRTASFPDTGAMHFEVFFFVAEPESLVRDRMIPRAQIQSRKADEAKCRATALIDLIEDFDDSGRSRMPFFGDADEPRYIVHRSMVDRYALRATRDGKVLEDLSVADLLLDPAMRPLFEGTFAIVGKDASLDDARTAMSRIKNCQDVFVTESGERAGTVVGWITNTMVGA